MKFLIILALSSSATLAQNKYYLDKADQPYFENDSNGKNDFERIDNTVKEINRMIGEMNDMKKEIAALKERVQVLEAAKK